MKGSYTKFDRRSVAVPACSSSPIDLLAARIGPHPMV
jgi:hypothetical protein